MSVFVCVCVHRAHVLWVSEQNFHVCLVWVCVFVCTLCSECVFEPERNPLITPLFIKLIQPQRVRLMLAEYARMCVCSVLSRMMYVFMYMLNVNNRVGAYLNNRTEVKSLLNFHRQLKYEIFPAIHANARHMINTNTSEKMIDYRRWWCRDRSHRRTIIDDRDRDRVCVRLCACIWFAVSSSSSSCRVDHTATLVAVFRRVFMCRVYRCRTYNWPTRQLENTEYTCVSYANWDHFRLVCWWAVNNNDTIRHNTCFSQNATRFKQYLSRELST